MEEGGKDFITKKGIKKYYKHNISIASCDSHGGVLPEKLDGGVCGPLPKTPTLFMTKICDLAYHT